MDDLFSPEYINERIRKEYVRIDIEMHTNTKQRDR